MRIEFLAFTPKLLYTVFPLPIRINCYSLSMYLSCYQNLQAHGSQVLANGLTAVFYGFILKLRQEPQS